MTYLRTLGGLVQEVASAAGTLAMAGARAAGYAVGGALEFLDDEVRHATKALKRRAAK